jgi:AraC-like DNA-binding protein
MVVVAEAVSARPAPALRPFVGWYSGYRQAGCAPAVHRGLPSPWLTMILTLDDPLEMAAHPDPAQPGGAFDALVGGLHTAPALIRHDGRQSGVQVALTPWGARALIGLPAGELAMTDVHVEAVLGRGAEVLLDAVRAAATWPQRFAALDTALLGRLAAGPADPLPARQVVAAWDLVLASRGRTDVAALADAVGWTPRHLAHRFGLDVGLSPKQVARVVRFDATRRAIGRAAIVARAGGPAAPSLADVAAAYGFYDQPHLDREFRALAGCPPSGWLAEELRNVQVPGSDAAAG